VPSGGKEAVGSTDLARIDDIPVLLGQGKSEGRMVRMMGHSGKIRLPQVIDFSFVDQISHFLPEHKNLLKIGFKER
jgi:hypothetical protein